MPQQQFLLARLFCKVVTGAKSQIVSPHLQPTIFEFLGAHSCGLWEATVRTILHIELRMRMAFKAWAHLVAPLFLTLSYTSPEISLSQMISLQMGHRTGTEEPGLLRSDYSARPDLLEASTAKDIASRI
jgi:hypothetical protein